MTGTNVTGTSAATQRKALNPIVKLLLELGPLALFFAVYSRLGIFAATGVLMAGVVVTLGVSYAMLKRIPVMPLVTAVIVLIFGSLTLVFHDETLIKIKPTALYLLFAAALFAGRWISSFLYGVTIRDPLTYVVVGLLVVLASAAAILAPARRAAYVEPMVALRYE